MHERKRLGWMLAIGPVPYSILRMQDDRFEGGDRFRRMGAGHALHWGWKAAIHATVEAVTRGPRATAAPQVVCGVVGLKAVEAAGDRMGGRRRDSYH